MCGLVRAGSQFRELFQEIVSRRAGHRRARGYYIKSRIGYGVWFFKRVIRVIFGPVFRRLSCLTFLCRCRFFRTVVIHIPYTMRTHIHIPYKLTRAYCKLQKLLPLAKLISKYASWHLMPSVTEIGAKDPAGGLKFKSSRRSTFLFLTFHWISYLSASFRSHLEMKRLACVGVNKARVFNSKRRWLHVEPTRAHRVYVECYTVTSTILIFNSLKSTHAKGPESDCRHDCILSREWQNA
jgi:hypothetical protein